MKGASATAGAVADSDNDGIADYYELHDRPFVTNPQRVDTDSDGVPDAIDPYPLDSSKTTHEQAASYAYNHLGQAQYGWGEWGNPRSRE